MSRYVGPERTLTLAEMRALVGAAPPAPNAYPTDSLQTIRDAAVIQSQRALDMARAAGLEVPDAND